MRTLIDRLLGRQTNDTVTGAEEEIAVRLKRARKKAVSSINVYTDTVKDLLELADRQRLEIRKLRGNNHGNGG